MNTQWLLIFDNVDDLTLITPFLSIVGRGHTLLTTRATAIGGVAQSVPVEKMTSEVGSLFLLRRAGILSLEEQFAVVGDTERALAFAITQVLDGLPLALDQAGAYIKKTPCSLAYYLTLYQDRFLLSHNGAERKLRKELCYREYMGWRVTSSCLRREQFV